VRIKGSEHSFNGSLNELLILDVAYIVPFHDREDIGEDLELFEEIRAYSLLR
jgi:hypothetical protein